MTMRYQLQQPEVRFQFQPPERPESDPFGDAVRRMELHRTRRTEAAIRHILGIPADASPDEAVRLAGDRLGSLEIVQQCDLVDGATQVRDTSTDQVLWWGRWSLDGVMFVWAESALE